MKIKKIVNFILATLITTISTTTLGTTLAFADTNNTLIENQTIIEVNNSQVKQQIINEFKALGDPNKEQIEINEDNYKSIINKKTGDIKHILYNENNEVESVLETNFYENIENFNIPSNKISREIIDKNTTWGWFDGLHYTISRNNGVDSVYAQNSKSKYKEYTVKNYWNDSNTRGFVQNVDSAENSLISLIGSVGSGAATAIVSYLGIQSGPVGMAMVKAVLKAIGYGSLVSMVTGITDKYNSYTNNVRTADRYWNNL